MCLAGYLSLPLYLGFTPPLIWLIFILNNYIFILFPSLNDVAFGLIGDIKITHLLQERADVVRGGRRTVAAYLLELLWLCRHIRDNARDEVHFHKQIMHEISKWTDWWRKNKKTYSN